MKTFLARLRSVLPGYRRRQRDDIAEELAALEQIAGRRELGNLTRIAEDANAAVSVPILADLASDLRFAFRSLKRDRLFTLIAVLSLALTLSANLALFGLMDALLWRQLPIAHPDRLVTFENSARSYFGYTEFAKDAGRAMQDVLAQSSPFRTPVEIGSRSDLAEVAFVSGNYFSALGLRPELGVLIQSFDDDLRSSSRAAVLSSRYWHSAYGGRADAIHRVIYIRDARFEIAGASLPGVSRASFTQTGIYAGRNFDGGSHTEWAEGNGLYDYVGPGFFSTAGTAILAGRDFTPRDDEAAQKVVIVNQSLAHRFFPKDNALGQNIFIEDGPHRTAYQVVGIIRDLRTNPRYADPTWYFPALQSAVHPFTTEFLIRVDSGRALSINDLAETLQQESARLHIERLDSAAALLNGRLDSDRLMARLAGGFGVLACILASVGIYGLLSYDVTRRTPEIGIRTALGARRADIARLILAELSVVITFGLSFGAVAAFLLARIVRNLLFGISAQDPRMEMLAALILATVACVAAALPARRAAFLDPMRALRSE